MVTNHKGFGLRKPRRTAAIIADYKDGLSMKALGERYCLSTERIRQILRARKPGIIRPRGRPYSCPD